MVLDAGMRCGTQRRKALLIGFTYPGTQDALPDIDEEVKLFRNFLVDSRKYPSENVKVVLDSKWTSSPLDIPIRTYVEQQIRWLVQDAQQGDQLVFYFAGHGVQIRARPGSQETDGLDEAMFVDAKHGMPYDKYGIGLSPGRTPLSEQAKLQYFQGLISDNDLRKLLVDKLPAGVRLYAFFDTCHSGTILDLDYHWRCFESHLKPVFPNDVGTAAERRRCLNGGRRSLPACKLTYDPNLTIRIPRESIFLDEEFSVYSSPPVVDDSLSAMYEEGQLTPRQRRFASKPSLPKPKKSLSMFKGGVWAPSQSLSHPPIVISISSAQDNQLSFSGGRRSMIPNLICILGENRPLSVQQLTARLGDRMFQGRAADFEEQFEQPLNMKDRNELRSMQCPHLGSMNPLAPTQLFDL